MTELLVRPLREDDLEALADITATSYYEVDARTYQRAWPDPVRRPATRNPAWIARTRAALTTDPGGCWAAEVDGEVVGGAVSRVRELMWILASFAVLPRTQDPAFAPSLWPRPWHTAPAGRPGMSPSAPTPVPDAPNGLPAFACHRQLM